MSGEEPTGRVDGVLSLRYSQVVEIITKLGHDTPCTTCRGSLWVLASHDGRPNLVNLPLVNAEGLAHWAFYLTCKDCGAAKFIDAAHIERAANQMDSTDD